MEHRQTAGHAAAFFTIIIWGTTFISTKVLLTGFRPVEILLFRFVLGFGVLLAAYPKRLRTKNWRQELTFALAGLCGVCLYYLLENIALTYAMASNVGVIVSVAPFFTAILSHLFLKSEGKLRVQFFVGFVLAMIGIICMSFNGAEVAFRPIGDLLALIAALVWGFYSVFTKKISEYGYPVVLYTRRIFFYGILFMLPAMRFLDFHPNYTLLTQPTYLLNFLYLGIGACALCFVTWNFATQTLGAVKTSVYIYITPVVTVVTSVLILQEPLTARSFVGMVLALIGLVLSERKPKEGRNTICTAETAGE